MAGPLKAGQSQVSFVGRNPCFDPTHEVSWRILLLPHVARSTAHSHRILKTTQHSAAVLRYLYTTHHRPHLEVRHDTAGTTESIPLVKCAERHALIRRRRQSLVFNYLLRLVAFCFNSRKVQQSGVVSQVSTLRSTSTRVFVFPLFDRASFEVS